MARLEGLMLSGLPKIIQEVETISTLNLRRIDKLTKDTSLMSVVPENKP